MNSDSTTKSWGIILVMFSMFMVGWGLGIFYAAPTAFTEGVKAHADGRYVVVNMPDGTQQVCKVKDTKKPVLLENVEILE